MASKCKKITQKWPKRVKGWESNLGPLPEKPQPYQLSHRGLVIELNLKYGSTHISLARFLVDPNSVWVHSPFQDVCLLVFCVRHLLAKRKFQKKLC